MTPTSVMTLTVYLAIMVIVATAAVGIRAEYRPMPPPPPRPVPEPARQRESPARGRHGFTRAPSRLARWLWRMSRVALRRTGEASVAAARATPELPAHAARLGRHVAGRAEVGRAAFDRGASRRLYRLLHPALLVLVPLRERIGALVLAVLGPVRDLADRAARAGRSARSAGAGAGADADTWQLRVAAVRRRAAQWRVPRPRRAPDLDPAETAEDADAGALSADDSSDPTPAAKPPAPAPPAPAPSAPAPAAPAPAAPAAPARSAPSAPAAAAAPSAPAAPAASAPAPAAPAPAAPAAPARSAPSAPAAAAAPSAPAAPVAAPSEPRPTPSAAAVSAARLALAGQHRDQAARHQAAARQAARHHAARTGSADPLAEPDTDRVIDLTEVERQAGVAAGDRDLAEVGTPGASGAEAR